MPLNNTLLTEFGELAHKLWEARGFVAKQVAFKMNASISHLNETCNGRRNPTPYFTRNMCRALALSTEEATHLHTKAARQVGYTVEAYMERRIV